MCKYARERRVSATVAFLPTWTYSLGAGISARHMERITSLVGEEPQQQSNKHASDIKKLKHAGDNFSMQMDAPVLGLPCPER